MTGKRLLVLLLLVLFLTTGCITDRFRFSGGWSGPVASQDLVYVGSRDGRVLGLSRSTGEIQWSYPLPGQDPLGGIYGTPSYDGDRVYVASFEGKMHALNAFDLTPLWQFPTDRSFTGRIVGGPAVGGGLVIFGDSEGVVRALDTSTGAVEWSFKAENQVWSTPAIVEDVVYFGSLDHNFYALSLRHGEEKWTLPFEAGGAIVTSPLVSDRRVFFGSFDGTFHALDVDSGEQIWQFDGEGWFWANPVTVENMVYATTTNGLLYALDASTGRLRWQFDLQRPVIASPAVLDGRIVVTSDEGIVFSLNARSGQQENPGFDVGAEVRADIGVMEDTVYVNDMDRQVWALRLVGGQRQLWQTDTSDR